MNFIGGKRPGKIRKFKYEVTWKGTDILEGTYLQKRKKTVIE